MKPALILGLVLAANAYKTEQVETRIHIKGNNLDFKDLKDLQNLIPRNLKFDDQADDELLVRAFPVFADDELIIAPTDQFGRIKPYPSNIRFDEQADNEYATLPYKDYTKFLKDYKLPVELQEKRADDELMTLPYKDYTKFLKDYKLPVELQEKRADDELATLPYKDYTSLLKNFPKELIEYYIQQADDELMTLPYKDYTKFLKDYKLSAELQEKRADDDELHYSLFKDLLNSIFKDILKAPKIPLESQSYDSNANDELLLLKDLLKPQRLPLDAVLPRDDELRVIEKVPRLRGGQISSRFRDNELPEIRGRDHTLILPI